ncbi:MAG: hypothetical protein ACK58T_25655, partial [Phycisphaerae bacterium]
TLRPSEVCFPLPVRSRTLKNIGKIDQPTFRELFTHRLSGLCQVTTLIVFAWIFGQLNKIFGKKKGSMTPKSTRISIHTYGQMTIC